MALRQSNYEWFYLKAQGLSVSRRRITHPILEKLRELIMGFAAIAKGMLSSEQNLSAPIRFRATCGWRPVRLFLLLPPACGVWDGNRALIAEYGGVTAGEPDEWDPVVYSYWNLHPSRVD